MDFLFKSMQKKKKSQNVYSSANTDSKTRLASFSCLKVDLVLKSYPLPD